MQGIPKSSVRTKAPEVRRTDIMDSAQNLFIKQGVVTTTVDQITSGANVAKGTFYLYFASKEELLTALGERFGQELLKVIHAAVIKHPEDDYLRRLAAWMKACSIGYLDSVRVHDAIFWDAWPRTRDGLVNNIVIEDLYLMLDEGNKVGVWSFADTRMTAVFLFNGIHSIVDYFILKQKRVNRVKLVSIVEDLLLRTVGVPNELYA
ncbi:TetR/AcrR family transcriptional regulator [Undibacterium sp. JH2W]|uniref:TetR/AcrR family transcriptional regulator n=1 Tax=Undibacterium sp. JH2W TaxID=3413037 RepID=UPI003BF26BFC